MCSDMRSLWKKFQGICFLFLQLTQQSGLAFKIGVVFESSVGDQIDLQKVNRAVSSNPALSHLYREEQIQLLWRQVNTTSTMFALEEVCGLLEEGMQALVSVLPCRQRQFVLSQSEMFHLPHVAIQPDSCDTNAHMSYSIHLQRKDVNRNKLIADVLRQMGWRSVTLIFDHTHDMPQRKSLLFTLSANMVESAIVYLDGRYTNVSQPLLQLRSSTSDSIIVMVEAFALPSLLEEAKRLGLFQSDVYWILMTDDIIPKEALDMLSGYYDDNILLIRKAWSGSKRCTDGHCGRESCMDDTACTTLCPYLTEMEAIVSDGIGLLQEGIVKLPIDLSIDSSVSCQSGHSQRFAYGEELINFIKNIKSPSFIHNEGFTDSGYPKQVYYELYSTHSMGTRPLTLVSSWNSVSGFNDHGVEKLFLNKFYDFGDRELIIATLESHPFSIPTSTNNSHFVGFAFDILNELAARLKFRYRIVEPPDRLYGAPNPDGTWNGMVGMVKRGEVDMAVGPFTITSIRESVIDFTKPYLEDSTGILTRKPHEEDSQIFQMFKPYSGGVWGAIAAATLFVGIISYLVNYYTPYSGVRLGLADSTMDELDFKENLWLIYSSAMEQGATYHPNATSGRIVLGFFWIFTIVVVATYTANLAAFLTVSVPYTPINSLGELLQQETIQPVVKDGTNLWAMFQSSKTGIYGEVWERLEKSPRATVTEDAVELVESGEYAYISDNALLQYIAIRSCDFAVANEVFNTAGYGFVMPENAPFQDAVNYNIMKMQEAGLIEKWRQKWWSAEGEVCNEERTGSASSLSLRNLGGAFLVYLIVAGVSIVCLGLEIIGKSSGIITKLRQKFKRPIEMKTNGFH